MAFKGKGKWCSSSSSCNGPPWASFTSGQEPIGINLGPLTATFKPASGCLSSIYGYQTSLPVTSAITTTEAANTVTVTTSATSTIQATWYSLGLTKTAECYPSSFTAQPTYFYSPARCPVGWRTAIMEASSSAGASAIETRAACCPSGYDFIQPDPAEPWLASLLCASSGSLPSSLVSITLLPNGDETSLRTLSVTSSATIHAAAINIRFKSGDFDPTKPAISATASTSSSSTASQINTQDAGLSLSDSLPQAARIGVAVGVSILSVFLISAFIFFFLKRRRQAVSTAAALAAHANTPKTIDEEASLGAAAPALPVSPPTTTNEWVGSAGSISTVATTTTSSGTPPNCAEIGTPSTPTKSPEGGGEAFFDDNLKYPCWRQISNTNLGVTPSELPSPETWSIRRGGDTTPRSEHRSSARSRSRGRGQAQAQGQGQGPAAWSPAMTQRSLAEMQTPSNTHEMQAAAVPWEMP